MSSAIKGAAQAVRNGHAIMARSLEVLADTGFIGSGITG
jgi:hypothetical protein